VKYCAIATDYDGTLATEGQVSPSTVTALQRYRDRGGTWILVTGRELADLQHVCPHLHLFQRVVVENGAVLYDPATDRARLLASPLPEAFFAALAAASVAPVSRGQVIAATWQPHGATVERVLADLGLAARVICNKRAVMVLPTGVNKATGLTAALADLGLAAAQVAAIGDAENDLDLLAASGWGVAVANALPLLQAQAQWVTPGARGAGVEDLVAALLGAGAEGIAQG